MVWNFLKGGPGQNGQVELGAFGKIPSMGDFVRVGCKPLASFETWVESGMAQGEAKLKDRWPDVYAKGHLPRLRLPRFACRQGDAGNERHHRPELRRGGPPLSAGHLLLVQREARRERRAHHAALPRRLPRRCGADRARRHQADQRRCAQGASERHLRSNLRQRVVVHHRVHPVGAGDAGARRLAVDLRRPRHRRAALRPQGDPRFGQPVPRSREPHHPPRAAPPARRRWPARHRLLDRRRAARRRLAPRGAHALLVGRRQGRVAPGAARRHSAERARRAVVSPTRTTTTSTISPSREAWTPADSSSPISRATSAASSNNGTRRPPICSPRSDGKRRWPRLSPSSKRGWPRSSCPSPAPSRRARTCPSIRISSG